jgi:hypothetical protein
VIEQVSTQIATPASAKISGLLFFTKVVLATNIYSFMLLAWLFSRTGYYVLTLLLYGVLDDTPFTLLNRVTSTSLSSLTV